MKTLLHSIGMALAMMALVPAQAYEGGPMQQVKGFLDDAGNGKKPFAIDSLYGRNKAVPSQQLVLLKQQWGSLETLYGAHQGYEILQDEKLSPSLQRIVALEKYAVHPVVWEFWFYQSATGWVLSQGAFNDRFQLGGLK